MLQGLTRLLLVWLAAMLVNGCIIVTDDSHTHYHTVIDSGIELETQLGEGAGVFVEYRTGGHWRLWTSCDTAITATSCDFEIRATAATTIEEVAEHDLEAADTVDLFGMDTLVLNAHTTVGSDAVELRTPAGDSLQIEVFLDGVNAPDYLVWFGSGYKHMGASSSPVVFEPDLP